MVLILYRSRKICFYFFTQKIERDMENKITEDMEELFYGREK